MKNSYKFLFAAAILALLTAGILLALGKGQETGPALVFFFLFLALAARGHASFKGFSFTILIFAAVTIAMFYPSYLQKVGNFELKSLIVPLLQIIMFGMGTAMSVKDFLGVVKMPKGVLSAWYVSSQ